MLHTKLLTLLAALTFLASIGSQVASASDYVGACYAGENNNGWCSKSTIDVFFTNVGGDLLFQSSADPSAITQCNLIQDKYFLVHNDQPGFNQMFTAVLTAQLSNKKVVFGYKADDNGDCEARWMYTFR